MFALDVARFLVLAETDEIALQAIPAVPRYFVRSANQHQSGGSPSAVAPLAAKSFAAVL
jgi:hypothetical protein